MNTTPNIQPWRRSRRLTQRELRVLLFAAAGHTTKTTAARCGVSPETVRAQRDSCRKKLGATSIANAVALALIRGVFSEHLEQKIAEVAAGRIRREAAEK
jgi:DNA-binding CsgD family transcriptional regulator